MKPLSLFSNNQQPITNNQTLAIAVSGGADSMALLLLAHEQHENIVALTVDHGLRKESAEEAKQVATWCQARGIEHHILKIPEKIQGRQADAREARYALLTGWCKAHGVKYLLTAHHRGDQAETLFFRLARGSNLRGLACIAPVSEMQGVQLIRPLLSASKRELVDYLEKNNQPWIEDPSNRNPRYTRTAIREALSSLPDADDIESRAAKVIESFARIRDAIDRKTGEAFARVVQLHKTSARIDAPAFAALPPETAFLLTGHLIQRLTGDDHPPRTEKLERLARWLAAPDSKRAELAHVAFSHLPAKNLFEASLTS